MILANARRYFRATTVSLARPRCSRFNGYGQTLGLLFSVI